jgi:hypothetical protein
MDKNYSLLTQRSSFGTRWGFLAFLTVLGVFMFAPMEAAMAQALPIPAGNSTASAKFNALRTQMQGFAVVVLLIMLVIAAIMAAMQKVTMAINVAIAAIILFGGGYIMLLIYDGLK